MAGDGSMIIDRGLDQKGTDANIGTSRVNLTQRYVESVKYNGLGPWHILQYLLNNNHMNCVRKQTTGSALKRFSRKFI